MISIRRWIAPAMSAALMAVSPASAFAAPTQEANLPPVVRWEAWDAWNLSRQQWQAPIVRLMTAYAEYLKHIQHGVMPAPSSPQDATAIAAWRQQQMDAYQAFAAEAERQRQRTPPSPPSNVSWNILTKTVAAADPQWRDLTTGAVLADADSVQKIIDRTARVAGGDVKSIVALTREQMELQIRRSAAHAGWLSLNYSAPGDPSRDFFDYQIEIDRSLIAMLRAVIVDLSVMEGDPSARLDREAVAGEIRLHAANAERALATLDRHTAATLMSLDSPQFVGREYQAARFRSSMAAFRNAAVGLAPVTVELRRMAQTIEASGSSPSDWFEHAKNVAGIMERIAQPFDPPTAIGGG